jgi:hypothetical protein
MGILGGVQATVLLASSVWDTYAAVEAICPKSPGPWLPAAGGAAPGLVGAVAVDMGRCCGGAGALLGAGAAGREGAEARGDGPPRRGIFVRCESVWRLIGS